MNDLHKLHQLYAEELLFPGGGGNHEILPERENWESSTRRSRKRGSPPEKVKEAFFKPKPSPCPESFITLSFRVHRERKAVSRSFDRSQVSSSWLHAR